jgi:Syncollin/Beta/Gamma crystallin
MRTPSRESVMIKQALFGLAAMGLVTLAAEANARADTCARLYEHAGFGGEVKYVESGSDVTYIGNLWNDKVSSVQVTAGCTLNVWEHANYGGRHSTYGGRIPYVGDDWNDIISSFTCDCAR